MSRHVGELAELYALSSLDDRERASVERHVQSCSECAERIREAEETVAFISDLQEHHDPPQTITERFASRLALSRAEQKSLSLKVIATAVVIGLMILAGG
jgi:anti-sigma-K factor RskA